MGNLIILSFFLDAEQPDYHNLKSVSANGNVGSNPFWKSLFNRVNGMGALAVAHLILLGRIGTWLALFFSIFFSKTERASRAINKRGFSGMEST